MKREGREAAEHEQPSPGSELDRMRADRSAWPRSGGDKTADIQRDNSTGPDTTELTAASRAGDSLSLRRIYDSGQLAAALDGYGMDHESMRRAVECGRLMAHGCSEAQWQRAGWNERKEIMEHLAAVGAATLDAEPAGQVVASHGDKYSHGWSVGHSMAVADHIITADSPLPLVEVVAHEARHGWQDDVIKGTAEHPEGSIGRARLAQARDTYQEDRHSEDRTAYFRNEMELDAEQFARVAVLGYQQESLAIRKLDVGTALADLALSDLLDDEG